MMEDAHALHPVIAEAASTLVVYCSDFRLQRAFRWFLEESLNIKAYDLLAVPGGPQMLAAPVNLPKFGWVGERWTRFLVEAHGLTRVILVAHDDCGWYRHVYGPHADQAAQQARDLEYARDRLTASLPGAAVETYRALLRGRNVTFERAAASGAAG